MITFTVSLPPDLARFVTEEVADGSWTSADELFAYALTLARTASVLGHTPSPPSPVAEVPAPKLNLRMTPASGSIPVVDLTRQVFDSPSFMGELTRKLHADKK